jgi:glycosyltransferase involved in cell wall biosynthesis
LGSRWVGFGSVSTEALRVLYGSCFAYIYTSSYEGFGLPILEAMSCGTPPVVANLSSFPEVGGAAALYAQDQTPEAYTQALQSLMRPEFRETKIRQGLAHVKAFSWERTFECTLEFYKKVLS